MTVKTNVGKKFLHLIEKHFPKNHRYHKIINKNTVKVSYSCMKNIENIIKSHNKELLHRYQNSETKVIRQCNYRSKNSCPLNGKYLTITESLVYSAKIETPSENFTYIGMTEGSFKTRYNNYNTSFRLPQYKSATKFSEVVWSF